MNSTHIRPHVPSASHSHGGGRVIGIEPISEVDTTLDGQDVHVDKARTNTLHVRWVDLGIG